MKLINKLTAKLTKIMRKHQLTVARMKVRKILESKRTVREYH